MTRKISALSLFLFTLCLVPRASFASSVNLTLESKNDVPYVFDVKSGNTTTVVDLSCLNDNRTVHQYETWTASATNLETIISSNTLPTNSGMTITELKLDAFLDTKYDLSNLTSIGNQEVQDAIWSILDNSNLSKTQNDVYSGLSGSTEDAAVQKLISDAQASLTANTIEGKSDAVFYSQFTFYVPTSWDSGKNYSSDIPQQFMGYKAITPEPSSLILLGTGLAGLAGSLRRRYKAAK
jgi:hypothetical protein